MDQPSLPFPSNENLTTDQRAEAERRWYAYPELLDFVSACRWAGLDGVDRLKTEAKDLYRKYR